MEVSFATARLDPRLAPYVRRLMGAAVRGGAPERQEELPVAGTAVVVELARTWRIGATPGAPLERFGSFAGGLSLGPAVSAHDGRYELVEAVLTPLGTAAVLGVPCAELADRVVELEDVVGPEGRRLAERLSALPDWPARLAEAQRWLLGRVALRPAPLRPDVGWAVARLDATDGRLPIARLQEELGCSRRHLAASFARDIGTTPKAYAQLVRFTQAAARLREGEAPAAVAAACGYTDQAHLTRHVRRFGATTPGRLRAAGSPVTSVQDAAPAPA
jgi:AraC-like DNA-binding protein